MSRVNILDRPLGKGARSSTADQSVSLSAFAYLYSEMVQYHQNRVDSISELERRLEATGYGVGLRVLELLAYRSREYKRETRLMNLLQFISTSVWKSLFGKAADSLERSIDHADEFMIVDYAPLTSIFVSVPSDFGGLSVDAYISGIVCGILQGSGFPARVTAHSVALEDGEAIPPNPVLAAAYMMSGSSSPAVPSGITMSAVAGHHATGNMSGGGGGGGGGTMMGSASLHGIGASGVLPPRREKTVFLVKFAQSVLTRDAAMG